ncbi:MAG TPA: HEAT repeat domain-containing protein [Longimicrobium sp.]|nr:HEAT repeat domain-containing protein [Longimicrobium sp.]
MPNSVSAYQQPLDRLMKLGAEPARRRTWPDYRHLGLTERHVPALIAIATDPALHAAEEKDPAGWAPVHAWRALGQLGDPSAAQPLLGLLDREIDNAWVEEEVPGVLGMLGPAALAGATLRLFDDAYDEAVRVAAARVIAEVAHEYPERHDEGVALLAKQLEDWKHQGAGFNAILVGYLAGLGATDAAPLMEAAFAAGAVDLAVNGDWEDVQVQLGLLEQRTTPPTPWSPIDPEMDDAPLSGRVAPAGAGGSAKARQRRKAQKQARKRNRKK